MSRPGSRTERDEPEGAALLLLAASRSLTWYLESCHDLPRPDVVLHGATGFVGRLTARYLALHAGDARVALSGRSKDTLLALRDELGVDWPVLLADATDAGSLADLAALLPGCCTSRAASGIFERRWHLLGGQPAGRGTLELSGQVGPTPWDAALASAMNVAGVGVHEEALLDTLLGDLCDGGQPQ